MTTLNQTTLNEMSEKAPKSANVILQHSVNDHLYYGQSYECNSTIWRVVSGNNPGNVAMMMPPSLRHLVEVIAIRQDGKFVAVDHEDVVTTSSHRAEMPVVEAAPEPLPSEVKNRAARMMKHQKTLSSVVGQPRSDFTEPEKKTESKEILFDVPKPGRPKTVKEVREALAPEQLVEILSSSSVSEADDFVSITEFRGLVAPRREKELFLGMRCGRQIFISTGMGEIIGEHLFDIQVSERQRLIRVVVGSGKMKMPKSKKLACAKLHQIIAKAKGIEPDATIGRIMLKEIAPSVFTGEF